VEVDEGERMNRDEHGKAREGRLTGSLVQRIMTGGPKAWNTVARDMRNPKPFFQVEDTPNMPAPLAWGQRNEDEAIANFWERHPEYEIGDPRFMAYGHADGPQLFRDYLAVSPDRILLRDNKLVSGLEIKCPWDPLVHVATIKAAVLPETCRWQVYHEMLVTGTREWWFVSYDPRATDPDWRYFDLRITAQESQMDRLTETLSRFLEGFTAGIDFTQGAKTARDFERMFS
jgi:hypothetical protein